MLAMPNYPYAIFPDPENLPQLPEELLQDGQNFYARLQQRAAPEDMAVFDQQKDLLYVLSLSDFVAKTMIQYPHECALLIADGALESPFYSLDITDEINERIVPNISDSELKKRLRILRRVHMVPIAWRDLTGKADIEEVFVSLSNLAEGIVCRTIDVVRASMETAFGQAYDKHGAVMPLLVLGMGKLGGGELNFSSDIDLICCYPYDGQTTGGARSITFQEYFTKVVQRFSNLLAETTADSFCYRIDLRLRPFGDAGPLVSSFDALSVYYETQGRTWERYALVKARLLGDYHFWGDYGDELIEMLRPFVYRRYLDYGAIESLRKLKHMIEAEVRRRNLGDNFKLGSGGIREIEFIAQVFELMRGGRMQELVERSLRKTLRNISKLQLLPDEVCQNLDVCYIYLNVELWESSLSADELASILAPLLAEHLPPEAKAKVENNASSANAGNITTGGNTANSGNAVPAANSGKPVQDAKVATATAATSTASAQSAPATPAVTSATASTTSSTARRPLGNSMAARMVAAGRRSMFGGGSFSSAAARAAAAAAAAKAKAKAESESSASASGAVNSTTKVNDNAATMSVSSAQGSTTASNTALAGSAAVSTAATVAASGATSDSSVTVSVSTAPLPEAIQQEALQLAQGIIQLHHTLARLPVGPIGRETLVRLMPKIIRAVTKYKNAAALFNKVALLLENTREKLLSLLNGNNFAGALISAHPILLDELIAPRYFKMPPHPEEYLAWLNERLLRIDPDDLEEQMEELRLFKKTMVLRIAMSDQSQSLPLMKISDSLTWLAEAILREISMLAWRQTVQKYGAPRDRNFQDPGFAIIAYGKLGGIELGYKSDLDMVFIREVSDELTAGVPNAEGEITNSVPAAMFYQRFVQRFMHLCTTRMSGGVLYDLDMRLRPDGDSGVLMTDLEAYDNYQKNRAWTWEHQALVRARAVAGSPKVIEGFNKIRDEVLRTPRDEKQLSDDVYAMRMKMRNYLDRSSDKLFDLKQGRGGMVDIEFIAQYLLLREAPRHKDMVLWSDNVRIFDECARLGILTEETTATLKNAYLAIRECYHRVSLADLPRIVALEDRPKACDDVVVIFDRIFHDAAERFVPPQYSKANSLPSVTL